MSQEKRSIEDRLAAPHLLWPPPFLSEWRPTELSKRALHAGSSQQILCGGQNETTELSGTWNSLLSSNRVSATITEREDSALETHRASLKHLRMLRSGAFAQVQLSVSSDFKGQPALRADHSDALGERSHRLPTFSISVCLREQRGRAHYTAFKTYVCACKGFWMC